MNNTPKNIEIPIPKTITLFSKLGYTRGRDGCHKAARFSPQAGYSAYHSLLLG